MRINKVLRGADAKKSYAGIPEAFVPACMAGISRPSYAWGWMNFSTRRRSGTCAPCRIPPCNSNALWGFQPEPPKLSISGATRWLTPNKALMQISLRYTTYDREDVDNFSVQFLLPKEGLDRFPDSDDPTRETIKRFAEEIQLLITDVMMPVMNGKELADRLWHPQSRDIKVLFISGYRREDIFPEDLCEDRSDWLPKPFAGPEFLAKVEEVLNHVHGK